MLVNNCTLKLYCWTHSISLFLYANIIMLIFEEIIFRGYVWNKLNQIFERKENLFSFNSSFCSVAFWLHRFSRLRIQQNLLHAGIVR
ncbi:type II CAAX prenyl endopeptidase Rce1 family protein [Anaerotignum propionicum]|uniref:CPBP family glutamic-type intramembrane protease n=1 Tax=Anaerotignum propionicum TaxID=28446 RepID=UPI003AB93BB1